MASQAIIKILFFAAIIMAVVLEVIGDVIFKKWALGGRNTTLLIGLSIYFIGSVFWALSLKYEYLSKAISAFTILNFILVVLVGVIYFKEDLSVVNKIGVITGIVSLVLIQI